MQLEIYRKDRLYDDINSLVIILSSLYSALECEKIKLNPLKPNDFIAIEGMATKKIIKLPIYNVDMFKEDIVLEKLAIKVFDYYIIPENLNKTITVFRTGLNTIFSASFINYYERYLEKIKNSYGTDLNNWPNCWSFAWAIRNAYSHNRVIHFNNNNHKGVSWRNIVIQPKFQNQLIDNYINFTDSLVLLLEMDKRIGEIVEEIQTVGQVEQ